MAMKGSPFLSTISASACNAAVTAGGTVAARVLSSQNASPRTLIGMPVLPRTTAARNPGAARRAVEDVAVLVDHRNVRRVLRDAAQELGVWTRPST